MSRDEGDLLPRNLYFDAIDRQMYTQGLTSKVIPIEQGRRHKLLQILIKDAEQMIHAARAAYHFDRPGNIELVIPQIADTLDDLTKHTRNFIADVEASAERYRRVNASIYLGDDVPSKPADADVEPDTQAPAAPVNDSSAAAPIAGEEAGVGAVVTPNTAAPAASAPKPGPGPVTVPAISERAALTISDLPSHAELLADLARVKAGKR